MMLHLNDRQRKWLIHFLKGGSHGRRYCCTKAARAAGYKWPGKVGYRIRHSPKISPLVEWHFYHWEKVNLPSYFFEALNRVEPDISHIALDDELRGILRGKPAIG